MFFLAKQNDEPPGRLTSKRLKKKSECVRTSYPNYVDMFDIGKWNELDEYLKYNKGSTGLDICTKVFNKKESEPVNFKVCKTKVRDLCEAAVGEVEASESVVIKNAVGEGNAGETTVVDKTVIGLHNVCTEGEVELGETLVGEVYKESEVCEGDVGKTSVGETVVSEKCESEVGVCEIRETEVVEICGNALHELENDIVFMSTEESMVFSIDPISGEMVYEESLFNSQQVCLTYKLLYE